MRARLKLTNQIQGHAIKDPVRDRVKAAKVQLFNSCVGVRVYVMELSEIPPVVFLNVIAESSDSNVK